MKSLCDSRKGSREWTVLSENESCPALGALHAPGIIPSNQDISSGTPQNHLTLWGRHYCWQGIMLHSQCCLFLQEPQNIFWKEQILYRISMSQLKMQYCKPHVHPSALTPTWVCPVSPLGFMREQYKYIYITCIRTMMGTYASFQLCTLRLNR